MLSHKSSTSLEPLGPRELEERCEFGVHAGVVTKFRRVFNVRSGLMQRMRSERLSIFAAASWLVSIFVFLMMLPYVEEAAAHNRGSWGPGPGFGAFLIQLGVTAGFAFSLGLLSIIRRERDRWFGAIPCIFGGLYLLWFAVVTLGELWLDSRSAIHRSLDLTVGILMALIGVFFLTWLLPRAAARFARELEADDLGETNTRTKMKAVKLFGITALVVGVGLILIHAFRLL